MHAIRRFDFHKDYQFLSHGNSPLFSSYLPPTGLYIGHHTNGSNNLFNSLRFGVSGKLASVNSRCLPSTKPHLLYSSRPISVASM